MPQGREGGLAQFDLEPAGGKTAGRVEVQRLFFERPALPLPGVEQEVREGRPEVDPIRLHDHLRPATPQDKVLAAIQEGAFDQLQRRRAGLRGSGRDNMDTHYQAQQQTNEHVPVLSITLFPER